MALLAHCAEAGGPFSPDGRCFQLSSVPALLAKRSFKPYFKLFTARQTAIAKACRQWPNGDCALC